MSKKDKNPSPVLGTQIVEPALVAGFSFLNQYGDKTGTMKNILYKEAKIYSQGEKWFVYYYYRNPLTNKFQRFKSYDGDLNRVPDKTERMELAEKLRLAINKALKNGWSPFNDPYADKKKIWNFGQALNYYKQYLESDNDLRLKTVQSYMTMVNMLQGFHKRMQPVKEITQDDFLLYLEKLRRENKWSNRTYNGYVGYVTTFLGWLLKKKMVDENVMKEVQKRKEILTKHKAFTDEEFNKLFAKLKLKADSTLYWFCRFIYHTGTRPKSEARLLQLKHVLYDRKLLFIPGQISKNKKDDYLPLADEIIDWLWQYKELPKDWFIFSLDGPGEKALGMNTMAERFREIREELNLNPEHTIYGLKHTRAIHLAKAGVSPYLIMQLFRHSSLDVTMKYLRDLGLDISREAVNINAPTETGQGL